MQRPGVQIKDVPAKFAQTKLEPHNLGVPKANAKGHFIWPNQYPNNNSVGTQQRQRINDEEFLRLGPVEMLKFVRKTEGDLARISVEQNRQIQHLVWNQIFKIELQVLDFLRFF